MSCSLGLKDELFSLGLPLSLSVSLSLSLSVPFYPPLAMSLTLSPDISPVNFFCARIFPLLVIFLDDLALCSGMVGGVGI